MLLGKRKNRQSNQSRHNGTHTSWPTGKWYSRQWFGTGQGGWQSVRLWKQCVHWFPPEARVAPREGDTGGSSPSRSWGGGFQASASSCSTELGHTPELVAPGSLCFVRDVFQVPVTAKMAQLRSRLWAAHRILKVWHPSIPVPKWTRLQQGPQASSLDMPSLLLSVPRQCLSLAPAGALSPGGIGGGDHGHRLPLCLNRVEKWRLCPPTEAGSPTAALPLGAGAYLWSTGP